VDPAATPEWTLLGADETRVVVRKGLGGRIVATFRGTPAEMALISTRRAETAATLFTDPGCPWWLQGQAVLLSHTDAPPPQVDNEAVLTLLDGDWASHTASLAGAGVVGVVRPGVDGDVAGVLCLTPAFEQSVLAALGRESAAAGFSWAMISEEDLAPRS
jgi:hypothetical protein